MGAIEPVLRLRGVTKRFFGVHALQGVDLELAPGEVHALVGHNGSGKSTLCRILAGLVLRDSGSVEMHGVSVDIGDPHRARELGISLIPQEPLLVPQLSAPGNIYLGRERQFRRGGLLRLGDMKRRAAEVLRGLDYECDLDVPAGSLSLAAQEMVAIARALVWDARVLILDEPTATLSRHEVKTLFGTMSRLREAGVAQVFISHRLEEVGEIADRVTLLVDGRVRATGPAADFPPERLAGLMIPEQDVVSGARAVVPGGRPAGTAVAGEATGPALEVSGLVVGRGAEGVSFQVRAGEVLGLTGQVGAGKTEILQGIIGLERAAAGSVKLFGRTVRLRGPADAVRAGIGYLPEDRARSLVPLLPGADNMLLSDYPRVCRAGMVVQGRRRDTAADLQRRLDVASLAQVFRPVRTLSGGNQQKVGVARWLFRGSRLLIFDEPTRGIDVATKSRVHALIRSLAADGRTVVVSSSDFREVVAVCDRALVLKSGRVVAELAGSRLTEEAILTCAL